MRDVLTQQATQINELAQHNHNSIIFSKAHKTKRVSIGGHEEVRPILTAPNKSLPSGLKLHQKNNGMEARRRRGERAVRGSGWSTVSAMSKPVELGMLTTSSHYGSHAVADWFRAPQLV